MSVKKVCCFTGHRSQKLPCISDDQHPDTRLLKDALRTEILGLAMSGCRDFLIGCADGMDVIFGELVLEAREMLGGSPRLVCCLPYAGFHLHYSEPWQSRCSALLQSADEIIATGDRYARGCFHIRNRRMVDLSTDVLAVYNGGPGGTAYTIRYASKQNKDITIFSVQDGKLWITVDSKAYERPRLPPRS